jgi:hypothetical protein
LAEENQPTTERRKDIVVSGGGEREGDKDLIYAVHLKLME